MATSRAFSLNPSAFSEINGITSSMDNLGINIFLIFCSSDSHIGYCSRYNSIGWPTITKQTPSGISIGIGNVDRNVTVLFALAAWSIPSIQIYILSPFLTWLDITPSNLKTCSRICSIVKYLLFTGTLYSNKCPFNFFRICISRVPHKFSALHWPTSRL